MVLGSTPFVLIIEGQECQSTRREKKNSLMKNKEGKIKEWRYGNTLGNLLLQPLYVAGNVAV